MIGSEEKVQIFNEMEKHLMQDEKPSVYFQRLSNLPWFTEPPFNMLADLKKTKQNPAFHPEGHVWNHTMLVVDEAAIIKGQSSDARSFMWAALLHDIGKPGTTRVRKGKITSYDHDKLGAKMIRTFFQNMPVDEEFVRKVEALVRWHMQILFVVRDLPFADIKTMNTEADINEVARLGLCDRMGRTGAERVQEEDTIRIFLKKGTKG